MMEAVLIQAIGFAGVACFIFSYQIKSNKALFLLQVSGCSLFCLQFLLLSAVSGCFNLLIVILRNVMLLNAERHCRLAWKGWAIILSCLSVAVLLFTWNGPLSLLPFIALVVSNATYWTRNARTIRLGNLICACPAWMIYDIFVGSIGGALSEFITLISILVSIYRYGWQNLGADNFGK